MNKKSKKNSFTMAHVWASLDDDPRMQKRIYRKDEKPDADKKKGKKKS
jgi:hypothetical protein